MNNKIQTVKDSFNRSTLNSKIDFNGDIMLVSEFIDAILTRINNIDSIPTEELVKMIEDNLPVDLLVSEINTVSPIKERLEEEINKHPEWDRMIQKSSDYSESFSDYLRNRDESSFDDELNVLIGNKRITLEEAFNKYSKEEKNINSEIALEDKVELVTSILEKYLENFDTEERVFIQNYVIELPNGETHLLGRWITSFIDRIDDKFNFTINEKEENIDEYIGRLIAQADKQYRILKNNKIYDKVNEVEEITMPIPVVDNNDLTEEERVSISKRLTLDLSKGESSIEEDLFRQLQALDNGIDKNRADASLEGQLKTIMNRVYNECDTNSKFYNLCIEMADIIRNKLETAKEILRSQSNSENETYEYYKEIANRIGLQIDAVRTEQDFSNVSKIIEDFYTEIHNYNISNPKVFNLVKDLKKELESKIPYIKARTSEKTNRLKSELDTMIFNIRKNCDIDDPSIQASLSVQATEMQAKLDEGYNSSILSAGDVEFYKTMLNNAMNTLERRKGIRTVL